MVSDWWKAIRAVKTISKSQMKNLERFKQEIVPSSDVDRGGGMEGGTLHENPLGVSLVRGFCRRHFWGVLEKNQNIKTTWRCNESHWIL